jgi:hypothetical protein
MRGAERFLEHWPSVLILCGLLLFWVACACGENVPVETLFVGPALMLAGLVGRALACGDL